MSRRRKILLAVVISSAVANCWLRGPVFGLLPFLIFTVPPALVVSAPLFWLRIPQRLSLIVAAAIGILVSYFFCAPPTTERLFTRHLGISLSDDVRNLQRWNDTWARDPGYYLRFYASENAVEHIVKSARLTEGSWWQWPPPSRPRVLLSIPEWWRPQQLKSPRIWQGWDARREFWVNLYFDTQSGLVYLEVLMT